MYFKPRNEQSQCCLARYMNCRRGSRHPAVSREKRARVRVRLRIARRGMHVGGDQVVQHRAVLIRLSSEDNPLQRTKHVSLGGRMLEMGYIPRPLLVGIHDLHRPKEIHGHCPSERETERQVSQDQNRMRLRNEQRPGMSKAKHAHPDFE